MSGGVEPTLKSVAAHIAATIHHAWECPECLQIQRAKIMQMKLNAAAHPAPQQDDAAAERSA